MDKKSDWKTVDILELESITVIVGEMLASHVPVVLVRCIHVTRRTAFLISYIYLHHIVMMSLYMGA